MAISDSRDRDSKTRNGFYRGGDLEGEYGRRQDASAGYREESPEDELDYEEFAH